MSQVNFDLFPIATLGPTTCQCPAWASHTAGHFKGVRHEISDGTVYYTCGNEVPANHDYRPHKRSICPKCWSTPSHVMAYYNDNQTSESSKREFPDFWNLVDEFTSWKSTPEAKTLTGRKGLYWRTFLNEIKEQRHPAYSQYEPFSTQQGSSSSQIPQSHEFQGGTENSE
ncbi:uncharacterized protein L201_007486 [Kwoniella dendrophila CBS 6074]|uniref:Uncharacterized protein n=1 Tax=Kwoniella dendrophila CBS 6074 TaxID=1295534 RepID=A0AAX4K4N8_9TREE